MKPDTNESSIMDTSKMTPGERAALEMAEAARDHASSTRLSDGASVFMGRPEEQHLLPFPAQSLEDRDQGGAFLARLGFFLDKMVNPDGIDTDGEIPQDVMEGRRKPMRRSYLYRSLEMSPVRPK